MKDKIQRTFTSITEAISDTLDSLKESAKEKGQMFVDDWLQVFPELEAMGLQITSFGVVLALGPSLEVEMTGPSSAFSDERIEALLKEHELNQYVTLVLKTIRTTRQMHKKLGKGEIYDDLLVKVRVKVPPEVRVYLGPPTLV